MNKFNQTFYLICEQNFSGIDILPDVLGFQLEKVQDFQYGVLYKNGEFITDKDEMWSKDVNDILIQTPNQFLKNSGGMCHDASNFFANFCQLNKIIYKIVYIKCNTPPKYPTHSFIIIQNENNKFVIIDLFSITGGIYPIQFQTLEQATEYGVNKWNSNYNNDDQKIQSFYIDNFQLDQNNSLISLLNQY